MCVFFIVIKILDFLMVNMRDPKKIRLPGHTNNISKWTILEKDYNIDNPLGLNSLKIYSYKSGNSQWKNFLVTRLLIK